MQFSIWDYLKERARKATLAGVAEALEELEGENSESSHEAGAERLRARLGGQVVKRLEEPENLTTRQPAAPVPVREPETGHSNGRATIPPPAQRPRFNEAFEPTPAPPPTPRQIPTQAPTPKTDPFEERLNGPVPKAGPPQGAAPRPVATSQQTPGPKKPSAPVESRDPSRNGHGPALPEFDPPPAEQPSPERRKRGRPRKD